MKRNQRYDAVLGNWAFNDLLQVINGIISGDEQGRFEDGESVITSRINTAVTSPSQLREGNVVQTRNTRYLLGKQRNTTFPDGHKIEDTTEVQMNSLRQFMRAEGYVLVYTDGAVFFRDELTGATMGFANAVRFHNKTKSPFKLVQAVKLQKSGNRVVVQSHKVSYITGVAQAVNCSFAAA